MIKHNKIKNTAFLYECLTRQITSDVLSNNDPSPALAIVKEFFKPTTILGKELVLYKALTSKKLKNEGKINYLVDSVLRERAKLNYSEMRRAKYNLVKKITEKYDLKDFFRTRISNYRDIASVYKLFEIQHNSNPFEETEIRFVVMENLKEKDEIRLYQGERHRIIGTSEYAVVAEIWIHTDKDNPSDENDIVRIQDDFDRN